MSNHVKKTAQNREKKEEKKRLKNAALRHYQRNIRQSSKTFVVFPSTPGHYDLKKPKGAWNCPVVHW